MGIEGGRRITQEMVKLQGVSEVRISWWYGCGGMDVVVWL